MSARSVFLASCVSASLSVAANAAPAFSLQHRMEVVQAGDASFDPKVASELEVMRARTGHLLVRPALNGHEAGWFIFDTGAGICCVSTPKAAAFDLEAVGTVEAEGVGGSKPQRTLRADVLELGPLTLEDVPLMETDLSFLREHLGVEISGVIGHAFFARCIVELDLAAPRIALYEPKGYELAHGEWSPLAFHQLIPTVKASVEGHECTFHLDIGSNSAISFEEPAVRRLDLLAGRDVQDAKLGGVGGFIAAKKGRVTSLELGGERFADVEAMFAIQASGQSDHGHDGNLGTAVLDKFLLTFDYAGERICFRKRDGN